MKKVFIDGSAGTTGLQIAERLKARSDIELLTLSDELRKDNAARKEIMNRADVVFLCLPDDAAREAVTLVENPDTAIIDASTAHRTSEGWVYGFPEIANFREQIRKSKRIANPGCHASGFIALVAPLISAGIIRPDDALSCFSLTGYSGGGKKMIAEYEDEGRNTLLDAPRLYGISQKHKHLPEMVRYSGLSKAPVFCPIVAPFYSGMEAMVPLSDVSASISEIADIYRNYYKDGLVFFAENADEQGFMSAGALAKRDDMQISVNGSDEGRIVLTARFDNLGKGASGAAVQNLNLLLGVDEKTGLVTG